MELETHITEEKYGYTVTLVDEYGQERYKNDGISSLETAKKIAEDEKLRLSY